VCVQSDWNFTVQRNFLVQIHRNYVARNVLCTHETIIRHFPCIRQFRVFFLKTFRHFFHTTTTSISRIFRYCAVLNSNFRKRFNDFSSVVPHCCPDTRRRIIDKFNDSYSVRPICRSTNENVLITSRENCADFPVGFGRVFWLESRRFVPNHVRGRSYATNCNVLSTGVWWRNRRHRERLSTTPCPVRALQ